MPKGWKMYLPAAIFFLAGFALLIYALAFTPEEKVNKGEVAKVEKMFAGIDQRGSLLGKSDAKERIVLFVDLQCVFCAKFSREGLPVLLDEVRSGRVKLDLRILSILGPDSLKAAKAAQAAAPQNKMWQFTELFYLNQGTEGSGYIDDAFISNLYKSLAIDQELADSSLEGAEKTVTLDDDLAFKSGIRGTPSFLFIDRQSQASPLVFKSFSREDILRSLREARR